MWNPDMHRLLQNPAYLEARRTQRKLQMTSQYVDLASALQVPQETANRLIDLLVDREQRLLAEDRMSSADLAERESGRAEVEETRRQHDAELSALLGETGRTKWQAYQESLPTRYQMHDLREALSSTADPLRDDQLEPLISAVHAERLRFNDEIREYVQSATPGQEPDMRHTQLWPEHVAATHSRIHASAAAILSRQQLAKLDSILDELRQQEAAQIQVERVMRGMGARGKLNMARSN
jgi:hypothetical protein